MQKISAGKFHFEPPFTSLDHLVGEREQCRRHVKAERSGGLEVDHQLELGRRWNTASGRASNLSQTASASRIRFVIASGCEISARWLASISIVFAPIRLAMKRSRSGLIVRSWVDTA